MYTTLKYLCLLISLLAAVSALCLLIFATPGIPDQDGYVEPCPVTITEGSAASSESSSAAPADAGLASAVVMPCPSNASTCPQTESVKPSQPMTQAPTDAG